MLLAHTPDGARTGCRLDEVQQAFMVRFHNKNPVEHEATFPSCAVMTAAAAAGGG